MLDLGKLPYYCNTCFVCIHIRAVIITVPSNCVRPATLSSMLWHLPHARVPGMYEPTPASMGHVKPQAAPPAPPTPAVSASPAVPPAPPAPAAPPAPPAPAAPPPPPAGGAPPAPPPPPAPPASNTGTNTGGLAAALQSAKLRRTEKVGLVRVQEGWGRGWMIWEHFTDSDVLARCFVYKVVRERGQLSG